MSISLISSWTSPVIALVHLLLVITVLLVIQRFVQIIASPLSFLVLTLLQTGSDHVPCLASMLAMVRSIWAVGVV